MKQWMSFLTAGIMGGLIVFGGINIFEEHDISTIQETANVTPVSLFEGAAEPTSFVDAAKLSTPAVVHIRAEESEALAKQRLQDNRNNRQRRSDFFSMEDFFGGFQQNGFGQFFRQKGSGSGVIVSADGYIATNNHVVEFADEIIVTLSDKKEYKARKIGTDPSTDLAVIKIEGENFPTVEYADSDEVMVGEWVLAVGNPFDYLTSTVTAGIVSAKGRDINIIKGDKAIEEFIQTDAAINPGNSGGALVNTAGRLIGINTAIATPTGTYAGYSFAIPSNLVKDIISDIITNGDIERASLGVKGYDVDQELIESYNLKTDQGFYVLEVISGSAAEYGGVLPGDVITKLNGEEISDFDGLSEALKFGKVGDAMSVSVNRNGKLKDIKVRLRKSL